jgi:alpha-glucoside transport system permease protein
MDLGDSVSSNTPTLQHSNTPTLHPKEKGGTYMQEHTSSHQSAGLVNWFTGTIGRLVTAFFVPAVTFLILWRVFIFLRDSDAPKGVIAVVAIIWGVGGVAALYTIANWLVEQMSDTWKIMLRPFVFVGPALAILGWYLFLPTLRSLYLSFLDKNSEQFVWFRNYVYAFTDGAMLESFRNNLLWLIFGTGLSVGFGLLIAILADRSRFETVAKTIIFMPMAISLVGAGVIWKFIYAAKPISQDQIGILNALLVWLGAKPVGWLQIPFWNNFFLIAIMVWMQTGYAMVLEGAAIKQVPESILEAARIDGANEVQIFFKVIIPSISGTIMMVSTTILIATLKIFDIVYSMTGGLGGTEVIASQQYKQMFKYFDYGRGSAIAIVLLVATIPIMWYNLRQFGKQETFK